MKRIFNVAGKPLPFRRPSCEGRGLKHARRVDFVGLAASPLMRGAWIETLLLYRLLAVAVVAPHARGVD